MQLGKHVYVQKPLTHDIYEARLLTEAAKQYKVVTQMGNQGASHDGTRIMAEWYDAGLIGHVHTVYTWRRERIKQVVLDSSQLKGDPIVNEQWPGITVRNLKPSDD